MSEKGEKIQKFLASSGLGSRRLCEQFVDDMRVTINGEIAQRGDRIFAKDVILFDGSRIRRPRLRFFKIYKPKNYLCTDNPKQGKLLARDLLPRISERLFAVGRLDKDFEGLLLYTNDGELCHQLTHPRYQVQKIYEVRVLQYVPDEDLEKISRGIRLSDGRTPPIEARIRNRSQKRTLLTLRLSGNQRRLIPRVFAKLNHPVERIKRIGVGPIRLKGLKVGESCSLDAKEVKSLQAILQNKK